MARARLRDRHQENLRKKLQVLMAEQGVAIEDEDMNKPSTSAVHEVKDEDVADEDSVHEQPDSAADDNENDE